MGSWSAAIFGNDTACDVKDTFFDQYNNGDEIEDIKSDFISDGDDEEFDTLFALAHCLWEVGSLDDELLSQVKEAITTGKDLENCMGLDADEKYLKQRKTTTEKFLAKISVPKEKHKKRVAPPKPVESKYINGAVLTFQYEDASYGALIVIESKHFDKETHYKFLQTDIKTKHKPTMSDVLSARILDESFHNYEYQEASRRNQGFYYTFTNCIFGYLTAKETKRFEQYNDSIFEIVGYVADWGACISGYVGTDYCYGSKTCEEFCINATKVLTEIYKKNSNKVTPLTIKEIDEEFTSTDPVIIVKKHVAYGRYADIIAFVELLPKEQQTPYLLQETARAYNNLRCEKDLLKAVQILAEIKGEIDDDYHNYLLGYAYFYLAEFDLALDLLSKSNPESKWARERIKDILAELKMLIKRKDLLILYKEIISELKANPKSNNLKGKISSFAQQIKTEVEDNFYSDLLLDLNTEGLLSDSLLDGYYDIVKDI